MSNKSNALVTYESNTGVSFLDKNRAVSTNLMNSPCNREKILFPYSREQWLENQKYRQKKSGAKNSLSVFFKGLFSNNHGQVDILKISLGVALGNALFYLVSAL